MMFEVDDFFGTDVSKLNASAEYRSLFFTAYGVETITSKEIAYALAQFMRTLISGNSKFDRFRRGEVSLNQNERNGMYIFFTERGDCFHCHISLPSRFTVELHGPSLGRRRIHSRIAERERAGVVRVGDPVVEVELGKQRLELRPEGAKIGRAHV